MQTLGLSDSTPKPTLGFWELFRPDLTTEPGALSACHSASRACYIIAGFTAIAAFFMGWLVLVDASLFVVIGYGIGKMSRTAAISGLLLYLLVQASVIFSGRFPGVIPFFVVVILFNSVRASFAYHHIRKSTNTLPPPYFVPTSNP